MSQQKGEELTIIQKCAAFMNEQLGSNLFTDVNIAADPKPESVDDNDNLYRVAQVRAKHSVITYFMGLVLKQFGGIFDKIDSKDELWLKTSMYHDRGYYSAYVTRDELDLCNGTRIKWYLLDDDYKGDLQILSGYKEKHPEDFAYEYIDIENYFKYFKKRKSASKEKLGKKNNRDYFDEKTEKQEHGILGGVLVFNELVNKIVGKNNYDVKELEKIKKFCLVIAQHNIYKILDKDDIEIAKQISDDFKDCINKVRIDEKSPLLLFLSLIDTVECLKKFSKSVNMDHYFEAKTIMDNLYLSVEYDKIILDFSKLREQAKKDSAEKLDWFDKTFGDKDKGYVKGIVGLNTWTILDGICDGDKITIQKEKQ